MSEVAKNGQGGEQTERKTKKRTTQVWKQWTRAQWQDHEPWQKVVAGTAWVYAADQARMYGVTLVAATVKGVQVKVLVAIGAGAGGAVVVVVVAGGALLLLAALIAVVVQVAVLVAGGVVSGETEVQRASKQGSCRKRVRTRCWPSHRCDQEYAAARGRIDRSSRVKH